MKTKKYYSIYDMSKNGIAEWATLKDWSYRGYIKPCITAKIGDRTYKCWTDQGIN